MAKLERAGSCRVAQISSMARRTVMFGASLAEARRRPVVGSVLRESKGIQHYDIHGCANGKLKLELTLESMPKGLEAC